MPTDATGTPTSLGIPTFNVDVDEPSGLGFNEAMVIIDSLLVSRSGVSSFVGRTGVVTANAGDYTAAKVTNAADKSSVSTQAFTGSISTGAAAGTFGQIGLFLQSAGTVWAATNLPAANILVGSVTGDTERRIGISGGGQLLFGPGNAPTDCTIERSAANTLRLTNTGLLSTSPTAGLGYGTGAGSSVTQITARSTAVTINALTGQIVTAANPLGAGVEASFTVNNSAVGANDVVVLNVGQSSGSDIFPYAVVVLLAGQFVIRYTNNAALTDNIATTFNFAVIKGANS